MEPWFDLDQRHRLPRRPRHHALSSLHDAKVPLSHGPIVAGAILYTVAFAYAIFYNYNIAKSATLAISTSMLQQLAVLGVVSCSSGGDATR